MHRQQSRHQPRPASRRRFGLIWFGLVIAACGSGFYLVHQPAHQQYRGAHAAASMRHNQVSPTCNLQEDKYVIVSISKRHLWACSRGAVNYESAVVTGQQNLAATATPVGTFHIASKQSERWLTGSDTRGHWAVYVHYWMPFVHNEYGNDGFHDATWRKPSEFGVVSPNSAQASHGCVELPFATAKWLYSWTSIGTTVVVRS